MSPWCELQIDVAPISGCHSTASRVPDTPQMDDSNRLSSGIVDASKISGHTPSRFEAKRPAIQCARRCVAAVLAVPSANCLIGRWLVGTVDDASPSREAGNGPQPNSPRKEC